MENINEIAARIRELREVCDRFYDAGFEDGKKNAVIVTEKPIWTEPSITTVYAAPARPYPYNYSDIITACMTEERSEDGEVH